MFLSWAWGVGVLGGYRLLPRPRVTWDVLASVRRRAACREQIGEFPEGVAARGWVEQLSAPMVDA